MDATNPSWRVAAAIVGHTNLGAEPASRPAHSYLVADDIVSIHSVIRAGVNVDNPTRPILPASINASKARMLAA